jgi:hypothetical protein
MKLPLEYGEDVEARRRDMGLSPISHKIYQKSYPSIFDSIAYPAGWRVLDFIKFDAEGSHTTWEHVSQYLAQLGEASSIEALRVWLFSLSLTITTFAWFSSPPHTLFMGGNHLSGNSMSTFIEVLVKLN